MMRVARVETMRHNAENFSKSPARSDAISRPDRPDHLNPWAMQLVVRRNKQDPANHIDVLEAAATAVVRLLDDHRTTQDTSVWAEAVAHWRAGWIRKVARRADNKRWDDVQHLDGVNASSGTAEVRALVPGPVAPLPPEVKKLQVGGTEFPRLHDSQHHNAVVTVELTPFADLSTGKAAAQAGHAAQIAYERLTASAHTGDPAAAQILDAWCQDEFRIRVQLPSTSQWSAAERPVRVIDAGLTEVSGATETSRAFW